MKKYALLILAAGKSRRMGFPKQLLVYNGKTFLQHIIDETKSVHSAQVFVVLGANNTLIESQHDLSNTNVLLNEVWDEGMSSSIVQGIVNIEKTMPNVEGVLILLCDQPFVNAILINAIIAKYEANGSKLIACKYDKETFGSPAFFHKNYFPKLKVMTGDKGAKHILKAANKELDFVVFEKAKIDIDTKNAYQILLDKQ